MLQKLISTIEDSSETTFTKQEILKLINSFVKAQPMLQSNGLILNPNNNTAVDQSGNQVRFPKKEFQLLTYLMSHPNVCCTRPNILKDVWGEDVWVDDRTIDVHIRKIKLRLGGNLKFIQTLKCVGYMWVEN